MTNSLLASGDLMHIYLQLMLLLHQQVQWVGTTLYQCSEVTPIKSLFLQDQSLFNTDQTDYHTDISGKLLHGYHGYGSHGPFNSNLQ